MNKPNFDWVTFRLKYKLVSTPIKLRIRYKLYLWIKILIHIRTHRVRSDYWISSLRVKLSSLIVMTLPKNRLCRSKKNGGHFWWFSPELFGFALRASFFCYDNCRRAHKWNGRRSSSPLFHSIAEQAHRTPHCRSLLVSSPLLSSADPAPTHRPSARSFRRNRCSSLCAVDLCGDC